MHSPLRAAGVGGAVLACAWLAASVPPVSARGQAGAAQTGAGLLPDTPMSYGVLTATFGRDGSFSLAGQGWPPFKGKWTAFNDTLELATTGGGKDCEAPGRYTFRQTGVRLTLALLSDACATRRLILDGSTWVPAGAPKVNPERRLVRTPGAARSPLPAAAPPAGSWPSFRGVEASADRSRHRFVVMALDKRHIKSTCASASPVAADGRIYLSSEDGDILVVAAGPVFKLLATNPMGESLMATPALSDGVMFVRGVNTLFAVSGERR